MRILAGDIGGTNSRLSIWERIDANPTSPLRQVGPIATVANEGYASFDAILTDYLRQRPDAMSNGGVTDACLGVAGPVEDRQVRMTNIANWPAIRADDLATKLKIAGPARANLINDMPAHGASLASIETMAPDHVISIRAGSSRPAGMRAIVMPGTGLGVGMLVWENVAKLHRPLPTEAGHADIGVRDDETAALVASMRKLHPHGPITREHIVSGRGLRSIYACLKNPSAPDRATAPEGKAIKNLEAADPIAKRTLDLFTRLLGELCGNVALNCLATGGIYLAGGIVNKSILERIQSPLFTDAFTSTGSESMRDLVASIPVKLVKYEETGLLGAATYASWVAEGRM